MLHYDFARKGFDVLGKYNCMIFIGAARVGFSHSFFQSITLEKLPQTITLRKNYPTAKIIYEWRPAEREACQMSRFHPLPVPDPTCVRILKSITLDTV